MEVRENGTSAMSRWIQTGGQDPNMEVDIWSSAWWWEQRDRRTDTYAFIMHPIPNILACLGYVIFVTTIGPWLMRDRNPYSLKTTMMAYNIFQVIMSTYLFIEGLDAGWGRHYSFACQNVEGGTGQGSTAMRMISLTHIYFLNKYIEFADTFFMVAKKKNNQITLLHVYHHAIMPIYAWIQVRYLPGGHEVFCAVMNCFVHMVMYSYYLLSSLGPKMQPYLWWKKYLTVLQLIQFCIGTLRTFIVTTGMVECGYPKLNCLGTLLFIEAPMLYMFVEFYKKSYNNVGSKTTTKKD